MGRKRPVCCETKLGFRAVPASPNWLGDPDKTPSPVYAAVFSSLRGQLLRQG